MAKKSFSGCNPVGKTGRHYSEELRRKIVGEVESGRMSQREVARVFEINRRTVDAWITRFSLPLNQNEPTKEVMTESTNDAQVKRLSKQVLELQKALAKANLKIDGLETMIKVSEEDLKIKIRKKPGAKQSEE
jgi:transposase-like protein